MSDKRQGKIDLTENGGRERAMGRIRRRVLRLSVLQILGNV